MDELIPMSLSGEYIEVNQVALQEHKNLGWRECDKREVVDDAADAKKANIGELREALIAKGIEFSADAKKADLQALLDSNQ